MTDYDREHVGDYLYALGYTYVGGCEWCGGMLVRKDGRVWCTNYGGCELAPG